MNLSALHTPLADGVTDVDGSFEFDYTLEKNSVESLHIALTNGKAGVTENGPNVTYLNANRVLTFLHSAETSDEVFDFGRLRVPLWERRAEGFTPRLLVDFPREHWIEELERAGWLKESAHKGLGAIYDFGGLGVVNESLGAQHVQDYLKDRLPGALKHLVDKVDDLQHMVHPNLTQKLRKEGVTLPESEEYHGELALNGFNPRLLKACDDGKTFYIDFEFGSLAVDGEHYAADTTAFFEKAGASLTLTKIHLRKRTLEGVPSPEVEVHTPDSEVWEGVKRIWRCNYFFFGQAISHLTETHLNVEQYILAVMRNVRLNPVFNLLTPHLHGTSMVNKSADSLLTSTNGLVVRQAPVTPDAMTEAVRTHYGTLNWHDWKPREAVCDGHQFAKQQKLYWEVLTEYVNFFFEEHAADIEAQWQEIKLMSDELVANAVPFVDTSCEPWQDLNEVNKRTSPHPVVGGTKMALSPVTSDDELSAANKQENLDSLKQFCKYIIFQATLRHKHVNDAQYDLGGDPHYATLGLTADLTDPKVDPSTAVDDNTFHDIRTVTYALSNHHYGYIMADEDKNMHPKLKELLEARRAAFNNCGLDIDTIRSCINV
eukprot:TRINITY_DN335_c0_g1_i2.p1 TRINITY_DN335_c0_g1~~TRINITY_DN335_c0_g1_i2.p1  ORF type:complete len:666 (+),score=327.23 TRINITY_DN335_c0_g1_i2:200-1999(+)